MKSSINKDLDLSPGKESGSPEAPSAGDGPEVGSMAYV